MDFQQQSLQNSITPFSSATMETQGKRRPRFQRQKSNHKCECHSNSKNNSSCDSFSLSNFYVKKSFVKITTPQKNPKTQRNLQEFSDIFTDISESYKRNLDSTRIQNKNDSQLFKKSQIHKIDTNEILVQSFLINRESPDQNRKQTENLLKKIIFYKEKCEKYETNLKKITIEKSNLQIGQQILSKENQKLKTQIKKLKEIIDNYIEQKDEVATPTTKRFQNKNLAKLKQQYLNFRNQEQIMNKNFDNRHFQLNSQFQQIKLQNDKLRHDLVRQNELYNLKLKMMQEKEEFLEKTLSFTKNSLNQLQKDYQDKQGQIIESKRFNDIMNDKNKEIETWKFKYQNIVKMLNGQRKRAVNSKTQKEQAQKLVIPTGSKSRHSLQVKSIIYNHKQNGEINCTIKTNLAQTSKPTQNLIEAKIHNKNTAYKQNYQLSQIKKISKSLIPTGTLEEGKISNIITDEQKIKDSSSDMTLLSSNSFELSPEKSQK